jgi:DMSO/TMAO reductase YedYZ molybdopterin-dependent catalytic subunit
MLIASHIFLFVHPAKTYAVDGKAWCMKIFGGINPRILTLTLENCEQSASPNSVYDNNCVGVWVLQRGLEVSMNRVSIYPRWLHRTRLLGRSAQSVYRLRRPGSNNN